MDFVCYLFRILAGKLTINVGENQTGLSSIKSVIIY